MGLYFFSFGIVGFFCMGRKGELPMTDKQKNDIRDMRQSGMGYLSIAKTLGISENTVKSYCRRNGLAGKVAEPVQEGCRPCLCCGRNVKQNPGRKEKKFCSDECRMKWWNAHPEKVTHRSERQLICPTCGQPFTVFRSRQRTYCSHKCYITARFGGGADE